VNQQADVSMLAAALPLVAVRVLGFH
jgi:hypothetical protein